MVSSSRPRVVIVGAGFGGLSAAGALKHAPIDVTIVDRHNYHLFQPLLYQVATASLSPAEIAQPGAAQLQIRTIPSTGGASVPFALFGLAPVGVAGIGLRLVGRQI